MDILFLNWKDTRHPDAGGAEQVMHEMAKRFVVEGSSVTLVTSRPRGSSFLDEIDGVRVIRIGRSRFLHPFMALLFYRVFLKNSFDVVVESINTSPYFVGFIRDRSKKFQLYYQLAREVWLYEMPKAFSWIGFYLLEPVAIFLNSRTRSPALAISQSTAADLARFGYRAQSISTFKIGMKLEKVDPDLVPYNKEAVFTILFHSSLREMKRPDHVIEAFRRLREAGVESQLWISGGGDRKWLESRAKELGVLDHVTFFGRVSEEKKQELMQKASVLSSTSIKEGWGIIVSEANGQGTPAIVYDVDGLRDAAAYSGSRACAPNPQSLAEELRALAIIFYQDPERYGQLCRQVRARVDDFNFDASFKEFKQILLQHY